MIHGIEHVNGTETEVALMRGNTTRLLPLRESSGTIPVIAMETENTATVDHLGQADLHHQEIHKNPTDSKRYLTNNYLKC